MSELASLPSPHPHDSPGSLWHYRCGCRCSECRAANAASARGFRAKHPQYNSDYLRRRYHSDPEAAAKRMRDWNASHPESVAARNRQYREAHLVEEAGRRCRNRASNPAIRDQDKAHKARRRALKLSAPGAHTAADIASQRARQKGKCYWCGEKVGRHYHVDHVVPLALGGGNSPENIVIACPRCNMSKGAKHPMDFAGVLL